MDKVIVYNPRTFEGNPSQPIKNYPENGKKWNLGVNQIGKFPTMVAEKLLKEFGFLREVKPEDVEKTMIEMKSKMHKCEHCSESFTSAQKLQGHLMGKHKLSKATKEVLSNIPEADGEVVPGAKNVIKTTPDAIEGIPDTSKGEVDGWYGGGLEDDTPDSSMKIIRPGQKGVFA